MRSPAIALAATVTLSVAGGSSRLPAASDTTTKSLQASVEVSARTSLTVSTELLQFVVEEGGAPAVATVDYVAGVRTRADAEVMLTIEALRDVDAAVSFSTVGGGMHGSVVRARPVVVGRWIGSGRRSGRIAFSLCATDAGTYTLPVRFVLSAP